MTTFAPEQSVRHPDHGEGRIVVDQGVFSLVQFGTDIHRVETAQLMRIESLEDRLADLTTDDPTATLAKAQALLIRSINDQWGVFTRTRVKLLPHQLWVCRQVTRNWPARWLVADDVGLGKTIEAGLILDPLLSSDRVKRVLVLTPARLAPQWRDRMKTMFDIRLNLYSADLDRDRVSYWETADKVVASFHTLRMDKARERLLEAEPWDLVLVDEAHHFQAVERSATLTYNLLKDMQAAGKIGSLVLFTGTPHRGKDFGFLALMHLLRPDLFDPQRDIEEQLAHLPEAMIRNNKATVTDLEGKPLFKPVKTQTVDYGYTEAEADFYNVMSEFILDGRAYASDLAGRERSSRMLLLIALQKLAASSIAAIRSALSKRRGMLATTIAQDGRSASQIAEPPEYEEDDERSQREESSVGENSPTLMSDEIARLDEILARADEITDETKIQRLIDLIATELPVGEPVLLFTEYKATQALVLNALEARFGEGSTGFINGDQRLTLLGASGIAETRRLSRETAAEDFNAGRNRFLISTEAGGEGIDLQHRCATLVHVDLPWNPMRLHQRVGRLNRYGQTRAVSVYLLRNPETVEARIWSLLEEKLARIQATLSASMEEAEDIAQLVIGMAGSSVFDELYSEGYSKQGRETLRSWWTANSNRFGGDNALATARSLFGSASKFDSATMAKEIPQLDLPQLEPFFRNAAKTHGRRVTTSEAGLSIATPEIWRNDLDLKSRYDGLTFDRDLAPKEQMNRMMGIGHSLVDKLLEHAVNQPVFAAYLKDLENTILLARVEDELTGTKATVHRIVLGVQHGQSAILRDGELLSLLNRCTGLEAAPTELSVEHAATLRELSMQLEASELPGSFGFTYPKARLIMALVPASNRVL
ncbi:MAG: helicase-related protein [Pseudomonadota bacterium]